MVESLRAGIVAWGRFRGQGDTDPSAVRLGESPAKFDYWVKERLRWYRSIGLREENLRARPYEKKDLAHYAAACTDIEYKYPWGWDELEGIAHALLRDRGRADDRPTGPSRSASATR